MKTSKKGFTLVELMFSVLFIGTLLLAIAMLTIQLLNLYTKGMVMRSVNATGNDIADSIRSTIQSSTIFNSSDVNPVVNKYVTKDSIDTARSNYFVTSEKEGMQGRYGLFCTRSYTYVFNNRDSMVSYRAGENVKSGDNTLNYLSVKKKSDDEGRPYGLIRIPDSGARLCSAVKESKNFEDALDKDTNAIKLDTDKVVVLIDGALSDENTDIQLYDFYVHHAVIDAESKQGLYNISFVLGTTRGGINVKSASNYCSGESSKSKTDEDLTEAESLSIDYDTLPIDYCSVNRFEFTVRQTMTPQ